MVMVSLSLLISIGAVLSHSSRVTAQSCWRTTACTGAASQAFPGVWDQYNYSPSSRTIRPTTIWGYPSNVLSNPLTYIKPFPGQASLLGNGSILVFDFGIEVGGIVSITYQAQGTGKLGLAFSESKNWAGEYSDSSNGVFSRDGAIYANITATSQATYTMPDDKMRGGFRWLTLFPVTSDSTFGLELIDITIELSFQPAWSNLRAYQGYFYSSDTLLNKIWYAGAYTLQTNAISPSSGRVYPVSSGGWENNQNINLGTSAPSIYVDGAKRDRTVWSGDLGIAVPSILVSTGDSAGVQNTLQVLYNDQASTGELPFAGSALNLFGSDTYHMATMIGTYYYLLYTNDQSFLSTNWAKYKSAMTFITNKIDSSGLLFVTGNNDWGRLTQGGRNSEANMLLYYTLTTGASVATWAGDSALSTTWTNKAATLKTAVNNLNYDTGVGAFKNTDADASIHPEDANAMALAFGVANSNNIAAISQQLTSNWISIGAVAPELPNNLVGFVQSFEVKGHLVAGQTSRALDLIRRAWGWYLNNPAGSNSTCIEGYLADGTFGYRNNAGYNNDYSYTSHSHGWSTGPTEALTSYVAGMRLTGPGGSTWTVGPQFGDLTHAEAGFTTPLGRFTVAWTLTSGGYTVGWSSPAGTVGTLVFPGQSNAPTVKVNGQVITTGTWNAKTQTYKMSATEGSHTAIISY